LGCAQQLITARLPALARAGVIARGREAAARGGAGGCRRARRAGRAGRRALRRQPAEGGAGQVAVIGARVIADEPTRGVDVSARPRSTRRRRSRTAAPARC
jgi:hypothetical protein